MRMMKIKDFAEVVSGSTPKTNVEEYWNGEYPWITPAEISDEIVYIYKTERYLTLKGLKSSSLKKLKKGTVLLSSRAPIGKVAIAGTELYCNQGFKNLICNEEIVDSKYIYYWLKSKTEYLNSLGRGATFKEISKSIVEQIEIPVPDLELQKKIVVVLDKVQELIVKRNEQIKSCDELIKSQFIEMFGDPLTNSKGWDVYNVSEVCTKITDGEHKNPEFISQGIPMVMANNVREYVVLDNCKYISQEDYDKFSKKCNPEYGDVLLVSRGATIGRCCKNNLKVHFALMGSVILLKPNNDVINADYLMAWFMQESIKPYIYQTSSATAQQAIYMKDLKEKRIILPPIKLQNEFAQFVQQVDKLKFGMEQSLKGLEDNFNVLMQKAFKGELF